MTDFLVRKCIKNYKDIQNPNVRTAYGKLAGSVGIFCNILLCVSKLLVGMVFGSVAIIADGINNLSDASSSIITLIGFKLSNRPADKDHPYGHARIEYLSGVAVAVTILIIGVELIKSSIDKIINPTVVEFTMITVVVLLASIVIKLWMAAFNYNMGKRINSPTLKATGTDSRNDVITTSAVLLAAVFAAVTKINIDGWVGLCVALFILYSGVEIAKDTLDPILGKAVDMDYAKDIVKKVLSYDGVIGTHDLMIHDYGPGRRFGSVHVEMDAKADVLECHDIIDNIERDFLANDHLHMVIHYDPVITDDAEIGSCKCMVNEVIEEISPLLSMHDFRMVTGPTHTNLIFDVMKPYDFFLEEKDLKEQIELRIKEKDVTYFTVITIDTSFIDTKEEK